MYERILVHAPQYFPTSSRHIIKCDSFFAILRASFINGGGPKFSFSSSSSSLSISSIQSSVFSLLSLKILSSVMVSLFIKFSSVSVYCEKHTESGTSSVACSLFQILFASASLSSILSPTLSGLLSLKFTFLKQFWMVTSETALQA